MARQLQGLIVLCAIAFFASLSLSMVYGVTKDPIAEAERQEKLRAIREVLPPFANDPAQDFRTIVVGKDKRGNDITSDLYYGRDQDGNLVGTAITVFSGKGYGGRIDVVVGTKPDGTVSGIYVLRHLETPGLGSKITEPSFTDQFKGCSLEQTDLRVEKDGGDIQAITGATISPRAVTEAVKWGLEIIAGEQASEAGRPVGG